MDFPPEALFGRPVLLAAILDIVGAPAYTQGRKQAKYFEINFKHRLLDEYSNISPEYCLTWLLKLLMKAKKAVSIQLDGSLCSNYSDLDFKLTTVEESAFGDTPLAATEMVA